MKFLQNPLIKFPQNPDFASESRPGPSSRSATLRTNSYDIPLAWEHEDTNSWCSSFRRRSVESRFREDLTAAQMGADYISYAYASAVALGGIIGYAKAGECENSGFMLRVFLYCKVACAEN